MDQNDYVTKQEMYSQLDQLREEIVEPLQMITNSLGYISQELKLMSQDRNQERDRIVDNQERLDRIEENQQAIVDKINEIPPTLYGGRKAGKVVTPLDLPSPPKSSPRS